MAGSTWSHGPLLPMRLAIESLRRLSSWTKTSRGGVANRIPSSAIAAGLLKSALCAAFGRRSTKAKNCSIFMMDPRDFSPATDGDGGSAGVASLLSAYDGRRWSRESGNAALGGGIRRTTILQFSALAGQHRTTLTTMLN